MIRINLLKPETKDIREPVVTPESACFTEIKQRINKTLQKKREWHKGPGNAHE